MPTAVEQILTTPPDLTDWQASLGDLVIGPGTPYEIVDLAGVDELPEIRTDDEARPWAHGDWTAPDWAEARVITSTLEVAEDAGVTYHEALAALRRVMVPTPGEERVQLWVKLPGRDLMRWSVKIRRHRIPTDQQYELGLAVPTWLAYAPDPVGYGAGVSATTGFREQAGGLLFPLFTDGTSDVGHLDFGEQGDAGELTLTNPGTAESWAIHQVAGPTPPEGFDIIDVPTGRRLRYTQQVLAGSTLEIDTATGQVTLDGVADRDRYLTVREWAAVPAGGATTLAFLPLGPWTTGTLTSVWAPAWW